jgi:hypothetical protein
MDRILSFEGLHQGPFVNLRIDSNCDRQECLDDLKLNLIVTIFGAAADRFNDCVNQQSRSLAIHGRWQLTLLIFAVVWTVPVQEVIAEEFLNSVEKLLDEARQL